MAALRELKTKGNLVEAYSPGGPGAAGRQLGARLAAHWVAPIGTSTWCVAGGGEREANRRHKDVQAARPVFAGGRPRRVQLPGVERLWAGLGWAASEPTADA